MTNGWIRSHQWHICALLALGLAISLAPVTASAKPRQLTTDGSNVVPAISPDGSKVAYVHVNSLTGSGGVDDADIYVINSDGSGKAQLTSGPAKDLYPSWSPDGSRIAFSSNRGGSTQAYTMRASDGAEVTQITDVEGLDSLTYHPVDNTIFLIVNQNGCSYGIIKLDVGTSALSSFFCHAGVDARQLAISPDGLQYVVGQRDASLSSEASPFYYLLRSDSQGQNLGLLFSGQSASYSTPKFVGNDKIGYASQGSDGRTLIFVRNLDGSNEVALTESQEWASSGYEDFSRDGKSVTFMAVPKGPFTFSSLNLYMTAVSDLGPERTAPNEALIAKLKVGRKTKLRRLVKSKARVRVLCSEACSGTVKLYLKGKASVRQALRPKRAKKRKLLATVKVKNSSQRAGKYKSYRIKLAKKLRRALNSKLRRKLYRDGHKPVKSSFQLAVRSADGLIKASASKGARLVLR